MKIELPLRLRAALTHLSCSIAIVIAAAWVVFFIWYPQPLSKALGVSKIFLILAIVDAAIGPLLTFFIYKREKKSLHFDLAIIIALQAIAFIYGIGKIAEARPAWLVFNMDRFDAVQTLDLDQRRIPETLAKYRTAPWLGPILVASKNPTDNDKRNELMFESGQGGPDLPQRIDLYTPLEKEASEIRRKIKPLNELSEFNTKHSIEIELGKWPEADGWLPLSAKTQSMTVLLRQKDAAVIAIVDLRPWRDD